MPNQKLRPIANDSGNFVMLQKVDRYRTDNASLQQENYNNKIKYNYINYIASYAFFFLWE